MSIWRDLKVKRRKTEVDMQEGQIVVTGHKHGVLIPVNAAVLKIVHEIEGGERAMGWNNLEDISLHSGFASPAR